MKKLLCIVCLLQGMFVTWSQDAYSPNREKFIQEFRTTLLPNPKHENEYTKFIEGKFSNLLLQTNKLSEQLFVQMVNVCNAMTERRIEADPHQYNYVFSVYSLLDQQTNDESLQAYQKSIYKLMTNRNINRLTEFINLSVVFFENRKLVEKSNFEWYYEQGSYLFKYEDNKAYIDLSGGDLICRWLNSSNSKHTDKYSDSIVVYQTSGRYDFTAQRWQGTGGIVTWEKVGRPKDETFAEVKGFNVSMKSSRISFDTVTLKTPYFSELIEGQLTETALNITRESDNVFPQFISFETNLRVKDIKPGVDYQGAFSLKGADFVGMSVNNILAKTTIIHHQRDFLVLQAEEIHISDTEVQANEARATLYLTTGDSIYHPSVNVVYLYKEKTSTLSRPSTGVGQAPFHDSYHQLDYYVPKIIIDQNKDVLSYTYEFGVSQQQKFARFESVNFLDHRLYDELQGLSKVNPLLLISKYTYKYDKYDLTEGECATALGMELSQAKSLMLQLASRGLINYDTKNKRVQINPKLDYYVQGKSGKSDYDNIGIWCDFRPKELGEYTQEEIKANKNLQELQLEYDKENEIRSRYTSFGTLDLVSLDMELLGVDQITISERQNAHVYPSNYKIVVRKNRSFDFQGWINVGKAEINALQATYNYELNKIDLHQGDKMLLRVQPHQASHGEKGIPMVSHIDSPKGEIAIDLPSNRSGRLQNETTARYPMLAVNTPTKVFYSSENFNIRYDSTRFYYLLNPFVIDSLDTFDDQAIRFQGQLISAGIFPIITEELKVMPDYSFGFSTKAPPEGLDLYGKDAKYDNKILLSANGLQGAGTINFVHSTSVSKNLLTFLPDSTIGYVQFTNTMVETDVEFPSVSGKEAFMTYIPKEQLLKASSTPQAELVFFDNQTKLNGTLFLRPHGMTGTGLMNFDNASLVSDKFVYESHDIFADTASFQLANQSRVKGENPLVFQTDNVNSHVDFRERIGRFTSNWGESRVDFPVNQYMCKMDIFTWYMDKEELDMSKKQESEQELTLDTGVELAQPNFFSLHPRQDSLQFKVPKATLSIKDKIIHCQQVEYVHVADAWIYPAEGLLNIHKRAKIEQLLDARIVANYITKYHTFEHVTVDILARKSYKGSGDYAYHDQHNHQTFIQMKDIGLDASFETVAFGFIDKEKEFQLSDQFSYYGTLSIQASQLGILFDGATQIHHECENFERNWLAFSSVIDPSDIQIPVGESMKNLNGEPIAAGIVWRDSKYVDSLVLYPAFLSGLKQAKDPVVITSSGWLTYDTEHKSFQISSKEKLINRSQRGNFLELNTQTCALYGEGVVHLGLDHGDVSLSTVGTVNYIPETDETLFDLTAKIIFPVNHDIFEGVARTINSVDVLQPINFSTNTLKSAISLWSDQAEADKFEQDFILRGEIKKLPHSLESTMTLSGLRLRYYPGSRLNQIKGLITTAESVALVNLGETAIMKYVPLKAFFQQKYSGAGGDWMAILMDIPSSNVYFYDYSFTKKDGILSVFTGDVGLVNAIEKIKDKKRKTKNFFYQVGRSGRRNIFNKLFSTEEDSDEPVQELEELQQEEGEENTENEPIEGEE